MPNYKRKWVSMEIVKKTYVKGEFATEKMENFMKIADEFHQGNWSALVLETLTAYWDLDPETGAPRSGKLKRPTFKLK